MVCVVSFQVTLLGIPLPFPPFLRPRILIGSLACPIARVRL